MTEYQQIFIYFIPPKYPAPPYNPSAWNYDNLIGMIWLQGNPASYDNSHTGQIEVREPSGLDAQVQAQGGSYDNRA
jgi:hypothetical protein